MIHQTDIQKQKLVDKLISPYSSQSMAVSFETAIAHWIDYLPNGFKGQTTPHPWE
jgi:hypothetical protein